MTKVELTPAFLIHRRAFKNSSLLLDFFTRDFGKIRLVGRGLRGSKTNIQMFQNLSISFAGRGGLKALSYWEIDDVPRNFKGEELILGMYVNELISRLLHEQDPYSELFAQYQKFVSQMGHLKQSAKYWHLRIFENNLLTELGYGMCFTEDINGNEIDQNSHYEYQPQAGFMPNSLGKISGKLINQLLIEAVEDVPDAQQLKVCRDLNRQRLSVLLDDKPLKSRSLFFIKQ
ncbi:DNA repair protein RecO [Abyssogena phaseoliformis symbiont OG214]|uniref:DNA repair protein RecO n=1 Tax=Abyssogena phaseoliformis symbiont TaxID=596095 RepID=UPI0019155757|nr:DNA repair protein RecO [Abyssogena phaseoliformis symbiont]BBB22626.1 DNA repair protein RecO [Abyssogena phaseoliformis symbiont OG214]